jgi:hypothetical protein
VDVEPNRPSRGEPAQSTDRLFHERLSVPLRWWVQGTMLVATLWLAVAVAVPPRPALLVTALALGAVAALNLSYGASKVVVDGGTLRAGRAQIGVEHLANPIALDREETRLVAGQRADARAYLLLRPYLKRAVQVSVQDPGDPTPYWLIASRRPERLAQALVTAGVRLAPAPGSLED